MKFLIGIALLNIAILGEAIDAKLPEYVHLMPDGKSLAVSLFGSREIALLDLDGNIKDTILLKTRSGGFLGLFASSVEYAATGLTVSADGETIYATGGNGNDGGVFKIDAESGKIKNFVVTGNNPMSPVLSPDGNFLYVVNRFDNTVVQLDAETLEIKNQAKCSRECNGIALGVDGKLLFVSNHLPNDVAEPVGMISSVVSVFDAKTLKQKSDVRLPNGSTGVRGIAASADGKTIYVTHTIARYQLPTTQLERGWMNTAGLSVIDGASGIYINTVLLDDVDLGAANPWGVVVSPDNKSVLVSHAGTREISVIDQSKLLNQLRMAAANIKVTEVTYGAQDVPNDLSFLSGIRKRIKFTVDGPRGIVATDDKVYTAAFFADAIVEIPYRANKIVPKIHPLGEKILDLSADRVLRGEMLFNDASICFQQWQSCATCHPDGRADALNWDLLNDGIGNPKQTRSMLLSDKTPPTMITGIRKDMKHCNRAGIRHIQFCSRPEEDPLCIDAYVMAMKAQPSPERDTKAIERGKIVFEKANCSKCHPSNSEHPYYTNLKSYDLKLGTRDETGRRFDTPTLVEVWRTAPYLYDGRALTLEELFTKWNPEDRHGKTSHLSEQEIKDLCSFVRSL